ncbi:MAG TPA: tRNA (adenosine(37)-N6)-threonylcarbamoyltransferase complex transferase subunit TsaD [Chthoniobacterales bacterium]|jgi:N6-L-threonylcarbamoyladenine synthase|nr:tRNA (adenosine(37)-N6)-threonylcarbamoyltransferase complex transferase subunit TsaD [Chthoniobacterales bacterium]
MTLLALETSCDETAIAILRGRELLASEVASQVAAHQPYGGVVPEVASRHHLQHAPALLEHAIAQAGISLGEVDAFAATSGPGLASSLLIGASLAKGLALGFAKPYLAINHLEGHLLSPFFGSEDEIKPNVSLIVSGGHTLLVEVKGVGDYRIVGRTLDDAAGEAFDKVAKMFGLAYPGGPEIERCAEGGDAARFDLPRSMLHSGDGNFSFSGLKTAVRYLLPKLVRSGEPRESVIPSGAEGEVEGSRGTTEKPHLLIRASREGPPSFDCAQNGEKLCRDLCASFQRAVVDVLVAKTIAAAASTQRDLVTVSGGVSRNRDLRAQMSLGCKATGLQLRFPAPELCTDNAAMIAFAASLHLERGASTPLTTEIDPNLALA